MAFTHLHVHTEFSLLDGSNKIKEYVARVKELGMNSAAITDHGVMFGVIDFYKAAKAAGINPILGCEVYVAPNSRFDREAAHGEDRYYHLVLLAENNEGYQNLMKIVSKGFVDGYYYKPRVDMEVLQQYHSGIIALSACLAGEVQRYLVKGLYDEAKKVAEKYENCFGKGNFFLELQDHGIPEQQMVNPQLVRMSQETGIELVATNDVHYTYAEDAEAHDILLCIQTGKKLSDENRMRYEGGQYYVKSEEEMRKLFSFASQAIDNTQKIADRCHVEIEFGVTKLPHFEVPEGYVSWTYLNKLCHEGLVKRYPDRHEKLLPKLDYELNVIQKMGYVDYYLIVWDFIHYAKSQGIPVGPGRGSGAGSILAYAIGITDIDPMKYGLLFERFLNPERVSMPDFDVDFCYEHRQDVIDYVSRKYGHDHVSQIITFGTMAAKMVIRDVARVLDYPYSEADKLAKMIPNEIHITIPKALEQNRELKELYDTDPEVHKLLEIAMSLEGMPRQASTHACGVVITKDPVDTYVPLYVRDGQISTQYIMTTLEELGLLKMDFLGLRTLTVIQDTINLVKQNRGIDVEFDKDMSDPKVYKLWQEGNTSGIFQFESQGMTNFMKELKPDCLEDLIAGVSLYRPGPMDQIPRYIRGKQNPGHNEYTHPSLEPILNVTYGCMVYQEQVMQIVRDLAGYSLGRADLVRRAMGKKKLDVMAKEREVFINGQVDENENIIVPGCVRNGIDAESANKIFDEMSEFAKYAFNKSHAACYAVVAYRTAYLKAYYPAEFMASMLNSFLGNLDKVPEYIDECKRIGIKILKPDINSSSSKFTVEFDESQNKNNQIGQIRFGLGSIKNVGLQPIDNIIKDRNEHGKFEGFTDFCERVEGEAVNKKCVESLIKAGAFDEFPETRATLLASFEAIMDLAQSYNKKGMNGQVSMFDLGGEQEENNLKEIKYQFSEQEEMTENEKLSMEKEMLGIYISGHPLEKIKEQIKQLTNISSKELKEIDEQNSSEENEENKVQEILKYEDGQEVRIAGIITSVKKKYTKNNKIMAFVTIEDLNGSVEIIIFEPTFLKYQDKLLEENIIMIKGRLSIREDDNTKIVAQEIRNFGEKFSENSNKYENKKQDVQNTEIQKPKHLVIDITNMEETEKAKLRGAIRFFNGERNNIPVAVKTGDEIKPCGAIHLTEEILKEFEEIAGKQNVGIDLY
mgnify:CR=1 FL=1